MNTVNIATTLRLENLREVTQTVTVNANSTVILLTIVAQDVVQEDGSIKEVMVPFVPTNSIFGDGSRVRIQYGKTWQVVKSLVLSDLPQEKVRKMVITGGRTGFVDYIAVRGVDSHILDMVKYGKKARPETVLETAKKRASALIVSQVLNPGTKGIGIWSPWASNHRLELDQVGYGIKASKKLWRLALEAAKREGVSVDAKTASLVFNMPWLMNDALLFVNRQPMHSGLCLQGLRLVVLDVPFAAPVVHPTLMKMMLGDEDGDPSAVFTGANKATMRSFINRVVSNIKGRKDVGAKKVYGIGYTEGNTLGKKGDKAVDVSLKNVTFDKGNLWSDFQGFKVKGIIGLLCTEIWKYAWAFARLLTESELVAFGKQSIEIDTLAWGEAGSAEGARLLKRIEDMKAWLHPVRFAPDSQFKSEFIAQLALELTYRVFELMFEHVFDARKGKALAYNPLDNLTSLSRTGRFDWSGMEAEGLWTAPLKLVASRIWTLKVSMEGKEYPSYDLKGVIAEHDPIYFNYVADRGNGGKKDQNGVVALMEIMIRKGMDPLVDSLYLKGGFIAKTVVPVPARMMEAAPQHTSYNMLEDAKPGPVFNTGPANIKQVHSYLAECGVEVKIGYDENGTYLECGNVRQVLPIKEISANIEGFGARLSEYKGHIIKTGTVTRACPPVLIHEALNPFATMQGKMVQTNRKDKFPGLDSKRFLVLNVYGVMAHIILGCAQEGHTQTQFVRKSCARIRAFINKCELVRNVTAEKVFADMLTVNLRKTGIGNDWVTQAEDLTAVALHEAGFSLYAVSKNDPMSKFVKIDSNLGVPRLVAAYDAFWALRTARRFDREALATLRQLREYSAPQMSKVTGPGFDGHQMADGRQMVTLAFFNSADNEGGHDPVDFTPSGMTKSATKDTHWVWMSLYEKDTFLENLDEVDRAEVIKFIRNIKASGFDIKKEEQIDDELFVTKYRVPVEWGKEDVSGITFKANFPGTKSQVKPTGRQLIASYTPIKSYNTLEKRMAATDKSRVILVDGIMPADTIVAKGAWSLIAEAAASRLEGGFVLETSDPEEIVTQVIPAISAKLEAEGKPGDGKMYIYRLGDDVIEPVMDGNKVLRAVVGEVPMYRIPFESDHSGAMTKYRRGGGIAKLGHIERGLVGELPTITQEIREEFAYAMNSVKQAVEAMPATNLDAMDFEAVDSLEAHYEA